MRMVTMLRPDYIPDRMHRTPPKLDDYITGPLIATYGTFPIRDMLSPDSVRALAKLANNMEKRSKYGKAA